MKHIKRMVLAAFLASLLVGCSSDTSSGGGNSTTLNRGGGEEMAGASAETSTSLSGTTSTASTGVYEAYVDRYPDLLAHYTSKEVDKRKAHLGRLTIVRLVRAKAALLMQRWTAPLIQPLPYLRHQAPGPPKSRIPPRSRRAASRNLH